ncbi:unnamed protein product [Gordionus sp. m RMFG-2023]|uniref:uncharacterized protein LOC135926323 n=1 Tax=Gordionus sp. m RMFG-2023 TaxID=3053472 RepID=UPI0030E3B188
MLTSKFTPDNNINNSAIYNYDDDPSIFHQVPAPPPPPSALNYRSFMEGGKGVKESYSINVSYGPSKGALDGRFENEDGKRGFWERLNGNTRPGEISGGDNKDNRELVERKTQQRTTQQVTKVTKVYTTRKFGTPQLLENSDANIFTMDKDGNMVPSGHTDTSNYLEQPTNVSTSMITCPPQTLEEKIITEMYDSSFDSPRHEEITYKYSPRYLFLPNTSPNGANDLSSRQTNEQHSKPCFMPDMNGLYLTSNPNLFHLNKRNIHSRQADDLELTADDEYPISEDNYNPSSMHHKNHQTFNNNFDNRDVITQMSEDNYNYPSSLHLKNSQTKEDFNYYENLKTAARLEEEYTNSSSEGASSRRYNHGGGHFLGEKLFHHNHSNSNITDDEFPQHKSSDYQDSPRIIFPTQPPIPYFPRHKFKKQSLNYPHLSDANRSNHVDQNGGCDDIYITRLQKVPEAAEDYGADDSHDDNGNTKWRDPEMVDILEYLSSPATEISVKIHASAYLQHLCFNHDDHKNMARKLGAIPILIKCLKPGQQIPLELIAGVCGVLRNLAYGKNNDESKKLIAAYDGIPLLSELFVNSDSDDSLKEIITGILWNMSSLEEIKVHILQHCTTIFHNLVIAPQLSAMACVSPKNNKANMFQWPTIFRNVTGIIRNCSSADDPYCRKYLITHGGEHSSPLNESLTPKIPFKNTHNSSKPALPLTNDLLAICLLALRNQDCDNQCVENLMCTLRNLCYQLPVSLAYDVHDNSYKSDSTQANSGGVKKKISLKKNCKTLNYKSATCNPSSKISNGLNIHNPNKKVITNNVNGVENQLTKLEDTPSTSSDYSSSQDCNNNNQNQTSPESLINDGHHTLGCFNILQSSLTPYNSNTINPNSNKNFHNSSKLIFGENDKDGKSNNVVFLPSILYSQTLAIKLCLGILRECANPCTLEGSAGTLQNLAAYLNWKPSIEIRTAVRKEKGLPVLVELLKLDNLHKSSISPSTDKIVCSVLMALRNLALDNRNKELIGKYAMKDLIEKLPDPSNSDHINQSVNHVKNSDNCDRTLRVNQAKLSAILAVLHQIVKDNPEFSQSFLENKGIERLVHLTNHYDQICPGTNYNPNSMSTLNGNGPNNQTLPRPVKYSFQILHSLWGHKSMREDYSKAGWKEEIFKPHLNPKYKHLFTSHDIKQHTPSTGLEKQKSIKQNGFRNLNGTLATPYFGENNTLSRPIQSQCPDDKSFQASPDRVKAKFAKGPENILPGSDALLNQDHYYYYLRKAAAHQNNGNGHIFNSDMANMNSNIFFKEPIYSQVNKSRNNNHLLRHHLENQSAADSWV